MAAVEEESALSSELEVLRSIYLDELTVSRLSGRERPWEIGVSLHPATADHTESQYVRFTLVLSLSAQYPDDPPVVSVRNPRGLSDDRIQSICQSLRELAEENVGTQMLFQLIEKGKEILTNNNIPHCQCVICLESFQDGESFAKTTCYHYFHSHCLARFICHSESELRAQRDQIPKPLEQETGPGEVLCPVCREPLTYDLSLLLTAAAPNRPLVPYQPDEKSLRKRVELQQIFERQQERGGIIDPEAERNRFCISLSTQPGSGDRGESEEQRADGGQCPEPKTWLPPPRGEPCPRPLPAASRGRRGRGVPGSWLRTRDHPPPPPTPTGAQGQDRGPHLPDRAPSRHSQPTWPRGHRGGHRGRGRGRGRGCFSPSVCLGQSDRELPTSPQ